LVRCSDDSGFGFAGAECLFFRHHHRFPPGSIETSIPIQYTLEVPIQVEVPISLTYRLQTTVPVEVVLPPDIRLSLDEALQQVEAGLQ